VISLFKRYPLLAEKLPHVSLGVLPTPIQKLDRLANEIGADTLYLKRDDLSGAIYGGNKIRVLGFLLGRALQIGAREVLTFGYAGSTHATATAVYAKELGLKSISMLLPQPNARYVRANLLLSYACGAELHQHRSVRALYPATAYQLLRHRLRCGRFPYRIAPGGSSPLGTIGYVDAAFELADQVKEGKIPQPDCIYVPLGSMGTAVGLTLGLRAVGVETRVVPVRVIGEAHASAEGMVRLFGKTNALLRSLDGSFPAFEITENDLDIRHDFLGQGYALFTEAGMRAVACMELSEGMTLDGTYTGKALAALIQDAKKDALKDKTVLFWNTYNSRDFSDAIAGVDYRQLPRCFHPYFEQDVQPLDRPHRPAGQGQMPATVRL